MCGRVRCTLNANQVAQACGLNPSSTPTRQIDRFRPSYNVSPGNYLPVVRVRRSAAPPAEGGEAAAVAGPVIQCMRWGLIPSFTRKNEKPDHYRMFNARSESIKEKASFRRLIPNNRCLVAVEGFYEWKKDGSKKQPYYIHFKDNQPLVFAALYDCWENPEGEILYTFTILTTRASSALEWLHDRMPVIFRDVGSITQWLNDSSTKHETILGPCEDPNLVWYPVTLAMGKPSFDGPECIKEIKPAGEKPLSSFFAKKSEVKCKSEPEFLKSSKQEQALDSFQEPVAKDSEERVAKERKDQKAPNIRSTKREFEDIIDIKDRKEPETRGIKRESDETADIKDRKEPEIRGIKREFDETEAKHESTPAKKKEKSAKNSEDKQASLLSYFGRR